MKFVAYFFICALLCKIVIIIGRNLSLRTLNKTRRILRGVEAGDSEPYMVYLRPAEGSNVDRNWLCGGAIIHEYYILTSAACIENIEHFYVVSGTHRWIPPQEKDDCVANGAMKAVWKCVPIDYEFDGKQFDNIRWMIDDIAVVKVEDKFNFKRRVLGCDFTPKKMNFNNISLDFEKPGTVGTIAGWGSKESFGEPIESFGRSTVNSPVLLKTSAVLMSTRHCRKHWPERYHYIIEKSMICAKDDVNGDAMSKICNDKVKCKELIDTEEDYSLRRSLPNIEAEIHNGAHSGDSRRFKIKSGGFCENDHGGPLVVGHGKGAMIVGIISACLATNITRNCYGPFLYTSVYKNRLLITCAIDKDTSPACRKYVLRSTNKSMNETTVRWYEHPDGPAKSEKRNRRKKTSKKKSK